MGKVGLIIKREYLTRVRKKSFIIMTLLGPLLTAGLMAFIVWVGLQESEGATRVMVLDENQGFLDPLESNDHVEFTYLEIPLEDAKLLFHNAEDQDALLHIPENPEETKAVNLFYKKSPGITTQRVIERQLERNIEKLILQKEQISEETFYKIKQEIKLSKIKFIAPGQEEADDSWVRYVGLIFAVFIYLFIFLYGVQVMRGVIEEKTSRVVEVIVSSVKPFQLMLGKIIGVAMVGLTQFVLLITFTSILYSVFILAMVPDMAQIGEMQMTPEVMEQMQQQAGPDVFDPNDPTSIITMLSRINFPLLLGLFAFYFIGGYLLYGALFAAIGSTVDSDTDTQQFMLPVSIPLICAYLLSFIIVENPEGPAAFWGSMVPFTSPIVMMVRVSMGVGGIGGVPLWEVLLSMALLVGGFLFTTWLAGRIYRTGILMYGKKVNYRELWKWLRHN